MPKKSLSKTAPVTNGKQRTAVIAPNNTSSKPLIRFPKLVRKSDLSVTELAQNQIYLIHNFFTPQECTALISYFDSTLPLKTVPVIPKKGEAFRSNDRESFEDPALADDLWHLGLQNVCEKIAGISQASLPRRPVGLNANLRVYRYREGQKFEGHYDDSVQDKTTKLWTDWTLLIYLNQDMHGGETVFYKSVSKKRIGDPISVKPAAGLALLHRHGRNCMFHEAKEVIQGEKWVLRSDVLIG
ncbi:hypothetical protein BX666DRAFT_1863431 [Dichotomocladium elegans]|nr:hypothetical protein BX666DRAFT_1863431 [Dichotomocladium elegans]